MIKPIRATTAVAKVLAAFLEDPAAERYGLDLMRDSGYPSGTLYPILTRLEKARWIEAQWEDLDPAVAGRPPRKYYRLTADGATAARAELAELNRQLTRGLGGLRETRTT
ncbi:PadR family transcriptional regulator [Actinoplanes siamensis]|uniref:Transcription regulator PadR N-terminal domain-containing protein n=1 Tax=Actinoplanes siamensis TaxID=1223317 RepID=A0A919N451_9ACTN|nr:helix-turn-helix transcriptional regulator [Actinoplanes siamensis]GIF04035.1 hypothetical protein Asi03nite_15730 [Actinoplanes siamensis]